VRMPATVATLQTMTARPFFIACVCTRKPADCNRAIRKQERARP
jgi:hypothetical protein